MNDNQAPREMHDGQISSSPIRELLTSEQTEKSTRRRFLRKTSAGLGVALGALTAPRAAADSGCYYYYYVVKAQFIA